MPDKDQRQDHAKQKRPGKDHIQLHVRMRRRKQHIRFIAEHPSMQDRIQRGDRDRYDEHPDQRRRPVVVGGGLRRFAGCARCYALRFLKKDELAVLRSVRLAHVNAGKARAACGLLPVSPETQRHAKAVLSGRGLYIERDPLPVCRTEHGLGVAIDAVHAVIINGNGRPEFAPHRFRADIRPNTVHRFRLHRNALNEARIVAHEIRDLHIRRTVRIAELDGSGVVVFNIRNKFPARRKRLTRCGQGKIRIIKEVFLRSSVAFRERSCRQKQAEQQRKHEKNSTQKQPFFT